MKQDKKVLKIKKSFVLTVFSVVMAVVIIILYYNSWGRLNINPPRNNEPQQQGEGERSTNFKGPSGQPYIKGPGVPPPVPEK